MRILIVEDSSMQKELLRLILKRGGYPDVTECFDVEHALDEVNKQVFDLIITDIHMSGMNGYDLIRIVKSKPEYINVPILVFTTEQSPEMKQYAKELGATGWLVKPYIAENIISAINKIQDAIDA